MDISAEEIWEAAPDGMVLVDDAGLVKWVNRQAETLFDYPPGDLVGQPVEVLVDADKRDAHVAHRSSYEQAPTRRDMGAGQRLHGRRRDGTTFAAHISLAPFIMTDGSHMTIAAVRDITARIDAEAQLEQATSRRMMAEDRDRIARELHDTVIQELFALGMGLQSVQPEAAVAVVSDRIGAAITSIDGVIGTIRTAIFGLHDSEVVAARTQIVEVLASMTAPLGFEPRLSFTGPVDAAIPPGLAEHLVAAVREALANVAKHAHATEADVAIEVTDDLYMRVRDNGVGIGLRDDLERSGLANLADRAALVGGTMSITPSPTGGTELTWRAPLATT